VTVDALNTMDETAGDEHDALQRQADRVAARMSGQLALFAEAEPQFQSEYRELLAAASRLGPAYAFDRQGRPSAIEAVRQALPLMERDLFDAILDDFACERAAIEEGLYRVALAYARRQGTP
jgi:hypothetical protein